MNAEHILYILGGAWTTLRFAFISILLAFPLGILLAACKKSSWGLLRAFGHIYTSIFRGTPVLVQLMLFYFGLPQVTGIALSPFTAGVLTFTLNSAAYSSEIIRAGMDSIEFGQWEAGYVLGLNKYQVLFYIIFPQVFRNSLPALINETIALLKETALVSTIGEHDILKRARTVNSETFFLFEPLMIAAVAYYVLVLIIHLIGQFIEKKVNHD